MASATHPLRGTDGDTEAQGGREMHLQFAGRTGPSFPLTQSRIQGFGYRCPSDLPHSPTETCFLCVLPVTGESRLGGESVWGGAWGLFLGGQDLVVFWAGQSGAEVLRGARGLGLGVPPVPEGMGTVPHLGHQHGADHSSNGTICPFWATAPSEPVHVWAGRRGQGVNSESCGEPRASIPLHLPILHAT